MTFGMTVAASDDSASLAGAHASIDANGLAGDVGAGVAAEEQGDAGDVFGNADAANWDGGFAALFQIILSLKLMARAVRVVPPRRERVDGDAVAGEIASE